MRRRRDHADDALTGAFPGERLFRSNVDVRYVLEPATTRPDALVVAFSAAHEPDEPPRYYTTRVLRAVPCHRLFVLDDHGPGTIHKRPSWYLGPNREPTVQLAVDALVRATAQELNLSADRIITCGASKGGWAALYFAARLGAAHAVAGEPQAFLGRHLLQDGTWAIVAHIAGDTTASDGEYLDGLLFDALADSPDPPHVHLFCGRGTSYYRRDVLPLTRFLDEHQIQFELTVADYFEHVPDLGVHFPGYLTERLNLLLGPAAGPAPPSSPRDHAPA